MEWEFPLNNNAGEQGPNDEGIQNFRGAEYKALAREMCQNSLDAQVDESKPVRMEFEKNMIDVRDIPDFEGYMNHLERSKEYWDENEEAKQYIKKCKDNIRLGKIDVLRISDYNTTGLTEPYEEKKITRWKSLVKISGAGNKEGEAGGSYGIGKKAAYLNSVFRMVFYRTLTDNNVKASQGVVRSITFLKDPNDVYSKTGGIGYFGDNEHNSPVEQINYLEKLNSRSEKGTDVFIYGFQKKIERKVWDKEIAHELLQNFILALYYKKLNVILKSPDDDQTYIQFDENTLPGLLDKYKCKDAKFAYQVLCSEDAIQEEYDFHGMGKLKLRLLIDSDQELNGKILIARKSKMTLFYLPKRKINPLLSFSGILELEGKELNEFFRQLETPAHDEWKPNLHKKDRTLAKEYYNELLDWVKSTVEKHGFGSIEEETNVLGLNTMLQENYDCKGKDSAKEENMEHQLEDVKFEFTKRKQKSNLSIQIQGGNAKADGSKKTKGTLLPNGDVSGTRKPTGERTRKRRENYRGTKDPNGTDLVEKLNLGEEIHVMGQVRFIPEGKSQYTMLLEPKVEFKKGKILLNLVGDNGKGTQLPVVEAYDLDKNSRLECVNGMISLGSYSKDSRIRIKIGTKCQTDYSMEVKMYVHR